MTRPKLSTLARCSIAAALVGLTAPAALAEDAAAPDAARLAKARDAVKELAGQLKGHLGAALKEGGPVAALGVCNDKAMPVTKAVGASQGLAIGRTALKVRNPGNAPDAFETRVLEEFAAKMKAGADVAKLDHAEVVEEGGVKTFRYMKAIPMAGEPCALCHGSAVKDDVKAAVAKLYPKDQATGFEPGELRGAFTVTEVVK